MLLGQHLDDLQILDCHTLVAHTTSHARILPDPTGRCAGADRARRTRAIALTVGARAATKAMTLHHALEAAAFGCPSHVDHLASFEQIYIQNLPDLMLLGVIGLKLAQV